MKQFLLITLFALLFTSITTQAQSTKTFTKTISLENLSKLNVKIESNVEYIPTNSSRVMIETTVTVNHSTKDIVIMDYISSKGLIPVKTEIDALNDTVIITVTELPYIAVDKQFADITYKYKVFVPKTVNLL